MYFHPLRNFYRGNCFSSQVLPDPPHFVSYFTLNPQWQRSFGFENSWQHYAQPGEWAHAAISFDSSTTIVRYYLNGQFRNSRVVELWGYDSHNVPIVPGGMVSNYRGYNVICTKVTPMVFCPPVYSGHAWPNVIGISGGVQEPSGSPAG